MNDPPAALVGFGTSARRSFCRLGMNDPPTCVGVIIGDKPRKATRCVMNSPWKRRLRKTFKIRQVAVYFSPQSSSQVRELFDSPSAVADLFGVHTCAVKQRKVQVSNRGS